MSESDTIDSESFKTLILDENTAEANLIRRAFERHGYEKPFKATSVLMALALLQQEKIDIVAVSTAGSLYSDSSLLDTLANLDFTPKIMLIHQGDQNILGTVEKLIKVHSLEIMGVLTPPISQGALSEILEGFKGAQQKSTKRKRAPVTKLTPDQIVDGIERGCLTPYFQPKVSVKTGDLVGVETLARWLEPDGSMVFPDQFIDVAEENGLIGLITRNLFRQAMQQTVDWRLDGLILKVSVNISVDDLNEDDFPDFILQTAGELGVDVTQIVLEVTETKLMSDIKRPLAALTRLRALGIGISIDDYGTGFSGLQQISRVPATELKVDREYVYGAHKDKEKRVILRSSIIMGHELDMSVVAEGAEDLEDWQMLEDLDCDICQGYFVARPLPASDILSWNEDWKENKPPPREAKAKTSKEPEQPEKPKPEVAPVAPTVTAPTPEPVAATPTPSPAQPSPPPPVPEAPAKGSMVPIMAGIAVVVAGGIGYMVMTGGDDKAPTPAQQTVDKADQTAALGPTNVESDIRKDTKWVANASPYIINKNLIIHRGAKLTIEEGTLIEVGPDVTISVTGNLQSVGSREAPIHWTRHVEDGKPWGGLIFKASSMGAVEYTKVQGAKLGLDISGAEPKVGKSQFYQNEIGVRIRDFALPRFQDNQIRSNSVGLVISRAEPRVENNAIRFNTTAGIQVYESVPLIIRNDLSGNAGITLDVKQSALSALVLADDNYWGDVAEKDLGKMVKGPVSILSSRTRNRPIFNLDPEADKETRLARAEATPKAIQVADKAQEVIQEPAQTIQKPTQQASNETKALVTKEEEKPVTKSVSTSPTPQPAAVKAKDVTATPVTETTDDQTNSAAVSEKPVENKPQIADVKAIAEKVNEAPKEQSTDTAAQTSAIEDKPQEKIANEGGETVSTPLPTPTSLQPNEQAAAKPAPVRIPAAQAIKQMEEGYQLIQQGDIDGALVLLEPLLPAAKRNADLHNRIALLKYQQKKYPEAIRLISKAIEINPTAPHYLRSSALIRLGGGDNDGAINDLERALKLRPDDVTLNALLKNLKRRKSNQSSQN